MQAWYDDDEFWRVLEPDLFPPDRWEKAPEEVDQVLALLGIEAPAEVLDLSCGPGRHSLELARRGFRVTGVDRTCLYLGRARSRAEEEGLGLELVHSDMRDFRRPGAFDAAISMFTSFGYFDDPADDRRVVDNLHASLRPGGRLLIDVMGKERIARIFAPRGWQEVDGRFLLEERKVTRNFGWIENRWIVIEGGEVKEFAVSHRLYSAVELVALVESCGFAGTRVLGDLAGAPYDQEAQRLVVVADRP